MSSVALPVPEPGRSAAERFVADHLAELCSDPVAGSLGFDGGQTAADAALERFDVAGYAGGRNEAFPAFRRKASRLSPYIRHGLLTLPRVWDAVSGPERDVAKFRDELLWQEYARHWYARLGHRTAEPLIKQPVASTTVAARADVGALLDRSMGCLEVTLDELEEEGWLVNQTRMWLASHWTVRLGLDWRAGEDYFFAHLLDGSRAANRLGWQWTSGIGSSRPYGFSRWQVEKRAPGLCSSCDHVADCPIDQWPDEPDHVRLDRDPLMTGDLDPASTAGPLNPEYPAGSGHRPDAVWLTAESLGRDDPALAANPDLPAVFVLDRPLLERLRLSSKRLVFLIETVAELADTRPVELHLGRPVEVLSDRRLATTFAPVPGWHSRAPQIDLVELHPWPWLRRPGAGSVASFSAWQRQFRRESAMDRASAHRIG